MTRDVSSRPGACPMCLASDENVLWHGRRCRIILVDDEDHAGYCRVIWGAHVKEMTDLASTERAHFMRIVFAAERAVRTVMHPDKINLATLGNQVPHLHWHVIPRYVDDATYPDSAWSPPHRAGVQRGVDAAGLVRELRRRLQSGQ
ncbi:MAG: HIT family protein [Gammaproteobacteria bacterium]|nr:HIT family protein [Gammaproteobacteria bacterium]